MPARKKAATIDPPDATAPPIVDDAVPDPAMRVLRRFRVVFNAVKTQFRQVEKEVGIGGAQLWALSLISAQPGIGVTELARAMDVHQSTSSNLVKSLERKALVLIGEGGTDRRAVALRATSKGTALLKRSPGPFAGALPEALSGLDARTLARLDKDLGKLIAALAADEGAAGVPLAEL